MELLRFTSLRDCNTNPILREICNGDEKLLPVTPSYFIDQISMSTEERLESIIKNSQKQRTQSTDGLLILPDIIVFQKFNVGIIYKVPLRIKNVKRVSCPLRIFYDRSSNFSIYYTNKVIPTKLAPGMEYKFIVEFNPSALKDYVYKIEFLISEKKYMLPIIAIGPRPLLDFPDSITLPPSIVKSASSKYILVRNKGTKAAVFDIHIKKPFAIEPSKGILEPNDSAQFMIKFISDVEGYFKEQISIHYETGETLIVNLEAVARCASIFLLDNCVSLEDVYVGLESHKTVRIRNESNQVVKFFWKNHRTNEEDQIEGKRIAKKKDEMRRAEGKFILETGELDENLYQKIYKDDLIELENAENFLYSNKNFIISPRTGEVWPNATVECTVAFSPNKVDTFQSFAYCKVTGRINRLELKLEGVGIGPKLLIERDVIDIGEVLLFKTYEFFEVIHNDGDIPTTIKALDKNYEFASEISSIEKSLFLAPKKGGVLNYKFRATVEGHFLEELHLVTEFQNELYKVYVQGEAIYPNLKPDVEELSFGEVYAGEKLTKTIKLLNIYDIDVPFKINITPNGTYPAVSFDCCKETNNFYIPTDPQEYKCVPDSGVVSEKGFMELQITVIPNVNRAIWCVKLIIETWNCPAKQIVIKLVHNVATQKLIWEPSLYEIEECCIDHEYEGSTHVTNKSRFPAYIKLSGQGSDTFHLRVELAEMIIEPNQKSQVKFFYTSSELGKQKGYIMMQLLGDKEKSVCEVASVVSGPVVKVLPEFLNFGSINVIEYHTQSFTIRNESPITAEIQFVVKENSPFALEDDKAFIPGKEEKTFVVKTYLNDFISYDTTVLIKVKHSEVQKLRLRAKGIGTAITVNPSIQPLLDYGPRFTKRLMRETLVFQNKGVRIHKIVITPIENLKRFNEKEFGTMEYPGKVKFKPFFFILKPEESINVEVIFHKSKPGRIKEQFFLHAKIEGEDKQQLLMGGTVHINFVDPIFVFSKKDVKFRVDIDVNTTVAFIEDTVVLTNETPLPLQSAITTEAPFYIVDGANKCEELEINVDLKESYTLKIMFDMSTFEEKSFSVDKQMTIKYKGHPRKDRIKVSGTVNYPTVELLPPLIDFGCITCHTSSYLNVELRNVSPLPVTFKFEWLEEAFSIFDIIPAKEEEPSQIIEIPLRKDFFTPSTTTQYSEDPPPEEELEEPVLEQKSKKGKKGKDSEKSDKKEKKKKDSSVTSKDTDTTKGDKKQKKGKGDKQSSIKPLPIENIFQHYYTEYIPQFEQIQIYEELHGPQSTTNLIDITKRNIENAIEMKQFLYPMVHTYVEDDTLYATFRNLPNKSEEQHEINSNLELVPYKGYLEPLESVTLTVSFRPKCNMLMKAKAICNIAKGVTQSLDITGLCANPIYEIEDTIVDFGRQIYNNVCQKTLKFTNKSYMPLPFSIRREVLKEDSICSGWFYTKPQEGTLEANSFIDITVFYQPGVNIKLKETFIMEIGDLGPVSLEFSGFGVMPQIYLNLTRPALLDVPTVETYIAVANITSDFLPVPDFDANEQKEYAESDLDIPKSHRKQLKNWGWVVISEKNKYPTKMDIDLATERRLFRNYVLANRNLWFDNSVLVNAKQHTGCTAPPYVIDFGYVVNNTIAHYSVQIFNYSPKEVKIKLIEMVKKSGIAEAGFNVQITSTIIEAGRTISLYVIFNPTFEIYPEKTNDVETKFFLNVAYGVLIPIHIRAVVTIPYITLSTDVLSFGTVFCGQCKRMNVVLRNTGFTSCEWKAEIQARFKVQETFSIKLNNGILNKNEYILLDVYFEPQMEDHVQARIVIHTEGNPEKLYINLNGDGIIPKLSIQPEKLHFEPCIPYTLECIRYLTIENCSTFPIEYYFSDFDTKILEEEKILRLLGHYYASEKLYLTPRSAGECLPKPILDFYNELIQELKYNSRSKVTDETASFVSTDTKGRRSRKKRISFYDPKEMGSNAIESLSDKIIYNDEQSLKDYIDFKLQTCSSNMTIAALKDPIKAAILEARPEKPEPDPHTLKYGILFIFYGSPYTDFVYKANQTARKLNLPALSVNDIILDALVHNASEDTVKVNDIINKNYFQIMNKDERSSKPKPEDEEQKPPTYLDLLEELCCKIETIKNPPKITSSKKSTPKSSARKSKSSKSSGATSKSGKRGSFTFLDIPQDTLVKILEQQIREYKLGLVIETLDSYFITKPTLLLMNILKAAGNLNYIHVIFMYNNFEQQNKIVNQKKEIEFKQKEDYLMKILKNFDEISTEDLDKLTEEEKAIYKNVYLAKRKEYTKLRLEKLREKWKQKHAKKDESEKKKKKLGVLVSVKSTRSIKKSDSESSKASKKTKGGKSGKKSDTESSKTSKSSKPKLSPEEQKLENEFKEYDSYFYEFQHIVQYWDTSTSTLTKEYTAKAKPERKKQASVGKRILSKTSIVPPKTSIFVSIINKLPEQYEQDFNFGSIIKSSLDYQKAVELVQESLIENIEMTSELFSVVHVPEEERKQNVSDNFFLNNYDGNSLMQIETSAMGVQRHKSTSRRRSTRRRKSSIKGSRASSKMSKLLAVPNLQNRSIIQPGEKRYYYIQFIPKETGSYNYCLNIEIMNYQEVISVPCTGVCDIPRIDMSPQVLFPKVCPEKTTQNDYMHCVFFENTQTFDFGSSLVCDSKNERLYNTLAGLNLHNISKVPCEVRAYLEENSRTYLIDRDTMTIMPGLTEVLVLDACPPMLGPNRNVLFLEITDNPQTEEIALECTGCTTKFQVSQTKFHFDRVLLNHCEVKKLLLVNDSAVSVNFEFPNVDELPESFKIIPHSGFITKFKSAEVMIKYYSDKVEEISKKKLHLQVYDEFYRGPPVHTEVVELLAETVDVEIDCEENINFGEVKIRKPLDHDYNFLNHGKYNILFEITEIPKSDMKKSEQTLLEMFKISATTGALCPNKTFTTKITFKCDKLVEFVKLPIYKCEFMDHITKKVLVSFIITASAKSFCSEYDIKPTSNVNFGAMLIGSASSQMLTITNTGHFDFQYNIICKRMLQQRSGTKTKSISLKVGKKGKKDGSVKTKTSDSSKKSSKQSEKSKKSDKSGKSSKESAKSKKSKGSKTNVKASKAVIVPPIYCGPFTINNPQGKINRNEKTEIEIECNLNMIGVSEEVIVVTISECLPNNMAGHEIKLSGTGCIPHINFDDFRSIFSEHYIVEKLTDFVKPKEVEQHCVFVKETKCLLFNNVSINTVGTAELQIFNNTMVDADIVLKTNSSDNTFTVYPPQVHVKSYSNEKFTVSFKPSSIQTYEGSFEIRLLMPHGYQSESATFSLYGEGRVPEINLIEPSSSANGKYQMKFNPTLLEDSSYKRISFVNAGDYPCKVILEVCNDDEEVFSLQTRDDTKEMLNCSKYLEYTKHRLMVKIIPQQVANFDVRYLPRQTGSDKCVVKLHVVNNPFENYSIDVSGEGFSEDIILEGIETSLNVPVRNSYSEIDMYKTTYKLDFGRCFLKTLQKSRFKITNRTENDIYKFNFKSIQQVTFIPCVGHLKPRVSKEIIVTFLSDVEVVLDKVLLECCIYKIEYEDDNKNELSWDDRQELIIYENNNMHKNQHSSVTPSFSMSLTSIKTNEALIEESKEPKFNQIENTTKCFSILLNAIAGHSSYMCPITTIEFADTFMFEKRVFTFDVSNTGDVNLEIDWELFLENSFPKSLKQSERKDSADDINLNRGPKGAGDNILCRELKNRKPRPLTGKERFIGDQCKSRESIQSSSMSTISSVENYMPFTISPEKLVIQPKQSGQIMVIFAPLDIYEYKAQLKGKILNLSPDLKHISIEITARSLMPCCYFDVPMSDYISSGRRKVDICADLLDLNTKVVEVNFLGIGIKHNISFNILNPTEETVEYSWHEIKTYEFSSVSLFSCLSTNGLIKPGKKDEALFSIFPQSCGTFESIYNFQVKKHDLLAKFLFVANINKPNVFFLKPNLNLKPTVLGINVSDYVIIRNEEDIDINYKFLSPSLYSEGRKQYLTLEAKKGIVPKNSDVEIKVNYNPMDYGQAIFKLKCLVDFREDPLILNVTAMCYEIQISLTYALSSEKRISLRSDVDNIIDIGDITPHHLESITFFIANLGNTGIYYHWDYDEEIIEKQFKVNVVNKDGFIKSEKETVSTLNLTALKSAELKNYKVYLQIKYGPLFTISLKAKSVNIFYKFSFTEYDFGPCYIQTSNICYYNTNLEFLNYGLKPLTLESNFLNTDYLRVNFKVKQIQPKSKEIIQIDFYPRKCQKYMEEITFTINTNLVKIKIYGEGVTVNVQVFNINDKCIDCGTPKSGQIVTKTIKVINKSSAVAHVLCNIWDELPYYTNPIPVESHHVEIPTKEKIIEEFSIDQPKTNKKEKKDKKAKSAKSTGSDKSEKKAKKDASKQSGSETSKKTKKDKAASAQSSKKSLKSNKLQLPENVVEKENTEMLERKLRKSMFKFSPSTSLTVLPNKTGEFKVTFMPTTRLSAFTEKIYVQVFETIQPLCILKACCYGIDFRLDKNIIPFGAVVRNCSRESKFVLINEGDIGSSFKWHFEANEDFSIYPKQGYSTPGSLVTFNVKYAPTCLNRQSRCLMKCVIDANDKPLYVELTGTCSDIPAATATVAFRCPVRSQDKRSVVISNSSGENWRVISSVTGEYFSCENIVNIAAKTSFTFDIYYRPNVMTRKEPHTGFVLLKLPNGRATVYNLEGIATPPEPIQTRNLEFPSKTKYSESFIVKNWSRFPQKFKMYTEDITRDSAVYLYEISGKEYIDVPGNTEKEYCWTIYVYKECTLDLRVIFMNDEKEYLYYQLHVIATKSKPEETINLTTCVRTPVSHEITLINPLNYPAVYKLSCNPSVLNFKNVVMVNANSEVKEIIEYKPLLCEITSTILEAQNQDLGTYRYEFFLTATHAVPEPAMKFICVLGEPQILDASVRNLSANEATFECEIDGSGCFSTETSIYVSPNQNVSVPVRFDPHELGNVEATLNITSSTAGEFIYPLIGICKIPKPKGPYTLRPGESMSYIFYNPFLKDCVFAIKVEPNAFIVNPKEELVKAKSNVNISIRMSEKLKSFNSDADISGNVTITPKDKSFGPFKWTLYIQGVNNM